MKRPAIAALAWAALIAASACQGTSTPTTPSPPVTPTGSATVSIVSPQTGATVTGTFTFSVTPSSSTPVMGVQFESDGVALGAEVRSAPYSISENSTLLSNGKHTLSAVARDASGNVTTASTTVTVYNAFVSDVTYCAADPVQKLDVYYPAQGYTTPMPAVVYIHGGAWMHGDKNVLADGQVLAQERAELNRRGYLVVSVNYRLAPAHIFPAFVEDVKCAVRYLRSQASYYGVDPNRIGAWGESAGGHLAAMLGVLDNGTLEGNGGYAGASSRVQAVVDYYGPSDLTIFDEWNRVTVFLPGGGTAPTATVVQTAFGALPGSGNPVLVAGSPVTYATGDDPPFLIFHGTADTEVDPRQSQHMFDHLTAAGASAQLVKVAGAGHGFGNGTFSPTHPQIVQMMANFFDAHLGGGSH